MSEGDALSRATVRPTRSWRGAQTLLGASLVGVVMAIGCGGGKPADAPRGGDETDLPDPTAPTDIPDNAGEPFEVIDRPLIDPKKEIRGAPAPSGSASARPGP